MNTIKTIKNAFIRLTIMFFLTIAGFGSATTLAQEDTQDIIGSWKTIDDETNEVKSIIEITEVNGIYSGRITDLFNTETENPICEKCSGDLKNQPVKGMVILNKVSKKDNAWTGGSILDPSKGKTYKVKMTLIENGTKLKVRGYIGIPTLGRTQIWLRN